MQSRISTRTVSPDSFIHRYIQQPMASLCVVVSLAVSLIMIDHAYADIANTSANIPEATIAKLMAEVNGIAPKQSATMLRRAYKASIRDAQRVVNAHPTAPNRFKVLHIILKLQRRLLSLDRSERTRADLFETCEQLAQAPDHYAELRLDADMLLSDRRISQRNADLKERASELRMLVSRYRDTPGELKSLMVAMTLADQLHDLEGKSYYFKMIQQRFAENNKAISFIRKHIGFQRMDVIFAGRFERNDGVSVHFPYDRMGHAVIAVFWSTKDEGHRTLLSQIKDQQDAQPGRFEIYSFNLDDLEDAGASVLKSIGLQCSAMTLPGGVTSETFRTYAIESPKVLLINEYGRTIQEPKNIGDGTDGHGKKQKEGSLFAYPKLVPSHGRYQMQLQSLFNGDFLVQDDTHVLKKGSSLPATVISDIQSLIPAVPFRYRLSPKTAHGSYSKIEGLCSAAIKNHSASSDLWRIRNFRIVALMGLWNSTGEPDYLNKAVAESQTLLSTELPASAGMVARYCLARHALRENVLTKREIITTFVKELGGDEASDMVHAAASVLALNANAVDLHERYRDLFLKSGSTHPYAVLSFLRNRHHRYYLFQGDISYLSLDRRYKHRERRYIINNDVTVPSTPFPAVSLKRLDGSEMIFPVNDNKKMTIVMFLEPPTDGSMDLDPSIYMVPPKPEPEEEPEPETKKGRKKKKKSKPRPQPKPSGILYTVSQLAESHVNKSVDVILAFLSDDIGQVKALNTKYNFPCQVVVVPSGLNNPIVRSLDIFSADRTPNIFFVRRDGTIPWQVTGFRYRVNPEFGQITYQAKLALRNHIYRSDVDAGYNALKSGNFKRAKTLFAGPYVVNTSLDKIDNWRQSGGRTEYHKWTCSQNYGKALAHIGLGEWDDALTAIEKAKLDYVVYFRHDESKPSAAGIALHKTHALILDGLGRKSEARNMRSKAAVKPTDYPTTYFDFTGYDRPYERFNETLKQLKIDQPK